MTDHRPITFLIHSLTAAGAECKTVTLANGFVARGRATHICVVKAMDPLMESAIAPGVQRVCFHKARVRQGIIALSGYLRRSRPRVIVCMTRSVAILAVVARFIARTKTPIVFVEGTPLSGTVVDKVLPAIRIRAELQLLHRQSQKLVANAHALAEELAIHSGIPLQDIAIIPNPSAAAVFEDGDATYEAPVDWPQEPVVITVCRLGVNKDVATLLRAFAVLRIKRPLTLVVLGDGPDRPRLEALTGELGCAAHVQFLGVRQKPWRYVRYAAVFVLSSHREGFPNALVEAMAVGCPVVATDAPGASRLILDNGRFGGLPASGDVEAMATAIADMLDNPVDRGLLVNRARQFAANQIDAHLDAFEAVAHQDSPVFA